MRRLVGEDGSPRGLAPVGGPLEHAPAGARLDRAVDRVGAGVKLRERPPARQIAHEIVERLLPARRAPTPS